MQLRSRQDEPETLRVHREMYERRLREMENNCGSNDDVDSSHSPAFRRDPEEESGITDKKAAVVTN